MKRTIFAIFSALLLALPIQAKNWCESLVNSMTESNDIDKNIAVNRNPATHAITNATYDFRFSSLKLYNKVRNSIKNHSSESDYYEESGNTMLLRFSDKAMLWNCKLQKLESEDFQFLVSVSHKSNSEKYQVKREAAKTKREAQREALKERHKAQQEAAAARREAIKIAKETRRKVNAERNAARRNSGAQTVTNQLTEEKKAEIKELQRELQQADAERKNRTE